MKMIICEIIIMKVIMKENNIIMKVMKMIISINNNMWRRNEKK